MSTDWLDGRANAKNAAGRLKGMLGEKRAVATPGAYDGMTALLAAQAGFEALYLSGAALSASMAMPDLGMLTLEDVARRAREIVRASQLPLIVDGDTGFGEALNVMRSVRELEEAGAACIQIEDQQFPKKCGHLNDKALVPVDDMCRKVAAAKRAASTLLICARTDAAATSLDDAIDRANRYVEAGADLIFVEALHSKEQMQTVRRKVKAPLLANMTEFGKTPHTTVAEWEELGYEVVIFPVSVFRVASKATAGFYADLKVRGGAERLVDRMMTRAELYQAIGYYDYEDLDAKIVRTVLD
ncbi:methylisocitrate lyase [Corticibacterium sp. UT-5YL-CI-8]|nr:methylisocitrate lyase [Tianweitania sp. UT-5YL-CI-8]